VRLHLGGLCVRGVRNPDFRRPNLDFRPASRRFAGVVRFGRFLLFTLLALWLPATMHCRLEAAGFFAAHDDCADENSAGTSTDCRDDVCPTVEEALYKESGVQLTAPAPAPFLLFVLVSPPRLAAPARWATLEAAPPAELAVRWQFLARAAPPARAPSLNR